MSNANLDKPRDDSLTQFILSAPCLAGGMVGGGMLGQGHYQGLLISVYV